MAATKKKAHTEAFPVIGDGLKITLSAQPGGLTVDKNGRPLLSRPFVFQCSPMETYTVAHTFNMGTYDTIDDDQFARRGSRQLDTWSFDTLAMYLGSDGKGHGTPGWVPYMAKEPGGKQWHRPEWYVDQLRKLFVAGSPFRYTAAFKNSTTIHRVPALLTAFNEEYRHGEGDCIYLTGMSFSEWRDPRGTDVPPSSKLPAHVKFRKQSFIAYDVISNRNIPSRGKNGTTFKDLARHYYGDASDWAAIAKANKRTGGCGSDSIIERWYKGRISKGVPNVTVTIPEKPK